MRLPVLAIVLLATAACRSPEVRQPAPPRPEASRPGPGSLPFLVVAAGQGVQPAEAPEELRAALQEELKAWGARPVDGSPGDPPLLRVRLEQLEAQPVVPPFYYLGLPGIASIGIGADFIAAASGADVVSIGLILGPGLVGAGIAGVAVGATLGGIQAHHNKRRGYPLLPLKAEVHMELGRPGDGKRFEETYRTRSLQSATRPLSAEAQVVPGAVRREMLRALAAEIRTDLARHYEWTVDLGSGSR